uniref:Cytidine and dCMP deaminase domain-containing protein 1 n=1 Tax=Latimeria chalumnae TaxID=7897 RepID=H3AG63_LATCH
GQCPRLSKVNLFTLLSLWMELFPTKEQLQQNEKIQVKLCYKLANFANIVKFTSLQAQNNNIASNIVKNKKNLICIHIHPCGGVEICFQGGRTPPKEGSKGTCNSFFTATPESTSIKFLVHTAGVNRISYWPADPEMSLLQSIRMNVISPDAELDAKAVERLKSNGRAHVSVLLQPLVCNMNHFVEETTKSSDFFQKLVKMGSFKVEDVFSEHKHKYLKEFEQCFLISEEEEHKYVLKTVGLENLCENPYFINLRQNMKDLILLLATVASGIPEHAGFGFYCDDLQRINEDENQSLPQGTARHCMIQARLLAYRTEDPKIGVGAVIWAEGKPSNCDGTGALYLIGCGCNAYPVGSEYADFPQMDDQQKDREIRKFRYIIHAEQNALTFRCQEMKEDEKTMIFITKCPCDECVPLIKGTGIKQIYTGDLDAGKVKADISYQKFVKLKDVKKLTWQQSPLVKSEILANGSMNDRFTDEELHPRKKICI